MKKMVTDSGDFPMEGYAMEVKRNTRSPSLIGPAACTKAEWSKRNSNERGSKNPSWEVE